MDKEKTITQQLEEIAEEMCDKYCKYPAQFSGEETDELYDVCENCPLMKLY